MAPRVFFVGEGPSDIGDYSRARSFRPARPVEGYIPAAARRLAGIAFEADGAKLASFGKQPITEPRDALGKKSRQALALAGAFEACALVFCTDLDREQGVKRSDHEAHSREAELRDAIEGGFTVAIAHDPELASIRRIIAVPRRIIEAWALADPTILDHPDEVPSIRVEDLWGREDEVSSKHPKVVLQRALGRRPVAADYQDLAERADLQHLEKASPSFEQFAREVRSVAADCAADTSNE